LEYAFQAMLKDAPVLLFGSPKSFKGLFGCFRLIIHNSATRALFCLS
jgi:hypothetical protein